MKTWGDSERMMITWFFVLRCQRMVRAEMTVQQFTGCLPVDQVKMLAMINLLQKAFYEVLVHQLHRYRRNTNHARGSWMRPRSVTPSDRADVGNGQLMMLAAIQYANLRTTAAALRGQGTSDVGNAEPPVQQAGLKSLQWAIYRIIVLVTAVSCIHCGRTDISSCEPPTVVPFRRLERSNCHSSERYGGIMVTTVDDARVACNGETLLDVDFNTEFVIGYKTGPGYSGCSNRTPLIDGIGIAECIVEVNVHRPPSMQHGPCNALIDDVSDFVAAPREGIVDLPIEFNGP